MNTSYFVCSSEYKDSDFSSIIVDAEGPQNSIFKTVRENLVHTKKTVVSLTLACFGGDLEG